MASERGRLVPTRRSRRLAGLAPMAVSSSTRSSAGDGLIRQMGDGNDDVVRRIPPVHGRPSPVRRFSDPAIRETLPAAAAAASARQSASSAASPTRNATVDVVSGPSSSSSSSLAAAVTERSSVATRMSVGSPGGSRRGRRGVVGTQRGRQEQGGLLRSYTEQLSSSPVQGESFCRCPQQGPSRDLQCVCGEDDHGKDWLLLVCGHS